MLMTRCSRVTPPFSRSMLSEPLAISVASIRATFLSGQRLEAFVGEQHDVSAPIVAHAWGDEVQQDALDVFVVVPAQSLRPGSQQLLAQVSAGTLYPSSAQQPSVASALQAGSGSALVELLLLSPHALISVSSGVGDLQHGVAGFGFTNPDGEQHELVSFGFTDSGDEQQELGASCFLGVDEEQEDSDALDF